MSRRSRRATEEAAAHTVQLAAEQAAHDAHLAELAERRAASRRDRQALFDQVGLPSAGRPRPLSPAAVAQARLRAGDQS